jgi:hypothetical protein
MLVFKIFVFSTFYSNAPSSLTKFITNERCFLLCGMSIFLTKFPVHPDIPNPLLCFRRQIFAHSQQKWLFARTPYVQSVLRKLTVMSCVPQLLNVYTVSTHICVFPISL